MAIRFKSYQGAEITEIIPPLSELRIKVFYDFPYLYEGNMEYEASYLKRYAAVNKAFVFAVWDNDKMVGATTALPLADEMDEIKKPFLEAGMDINTIYYFGESILLKEYRGNGYGHRFFDEREKFALTHHFNTTTFCSVVRPENHPLKPADYRSNDVFWLKRGYAKCENLSCRLSWLDREEEEASVKTLVFWKKEWK